MSKKKNKFKHSGKKHNQNFAKPVVAAPVDTSPIESPESTALSQVMGGAIVREPIKTAPTTGNSVGVPTDNVGKVKVENPDEIGHLNEKYQYVRRDVKKLLIILGVLVVLFVAFYFVEIKTSLFDTVGNWVYKIASFQI